MEKLNNINDYPPNCIRSYTGRTVNVFSPTKEMFCIKDIAHALSNICRFAGHGQFYSVGQHSVLCSRMVTPEHRMAALLHDISEAYLPDIPSPIKKYLPDYLALEDSLMRFLSTCFGFEYPLSEQVKIADKAITEVEFNFLMLKKKPLIGFKIMYPEEAEECFMTSYAMLCNSKNK